MKAMLKAKLSHKFEIVPVSWDGAQAAQRWQARIVIPLPDGSDRAIAGDPAKTKHEAFEQLVEEVKLWGERLKIARSIIRNAEENKPWEKC